MRRPAMTTFILFFGLATIDVLTDGRWPRIAFWLAMAGLFVLLDWRGQGGRASPR